MLVPRVVSASAAVLFLLLHPACGGSGGGDGDGDGDGDDAGNLEDRVIGTVTISYVGESTVRELPLDLSGVEIEALVVGPDGATTRFPGSGEADGTYTIFDVPEEPHIVRVASLHVATDKRRLDLGLATLGRDDAGNIKEHTPVSLTLTGLEPWEAGDSIEVFAPNAGLSFIDALSGGLEPSGGATTVSASLDVFLAQAPREVSSRSDDVVYITQVGSRSVGASTIREVLGSARIETGVEIESGSFDASMVGDLEAVGTGKAFNISWDTDAYSVVLDAMGPLAPSSITQIARRVATPSDPSWGILAPYPTLAAATVDGTGNVMLSLSYESPFPSHWNELEVDELIATVDLVPGGQYSASARASAVTVPGRFTKGAAPVLSAVESIAVAGLDASTQQSGVGLTPTISWMAPTTGLADGYKVELHQLEPAAGQIATFYTIGTELVLPDELLEPGALYFLNVRARSAPGADLGAAPLKEPVPSAYAERVSAPFSP